MATKASVYPNPSNGVFNLVWETEGENNSIYIYNLNGALVKKLNEIDLISNEKTIDLSDFPDGMYFIQLHGNNSVESVKVIKTN